MVADYRSKYRDLQLSWSLNMTQAYHNQGDAENLPDVGNVDFPMGNIQPSLGAGRKSCNVAADGSVECDHCGSTFKHKHHLLRHIRSVHQKQQHMCPVCRQLYSRPDSLALHVKAKHNMKLVRE